MIALASDDPMNDNRTYKPTADAMSASVFSFIKEGYLPTGGMVYFNDLNDDDPDNDIYIFMVPVKRTYDKKNECDLYITGWLAYCHNYGKNGQLDGKYDANTAYGSDPEISVYFSGITEDFSDLDYAVNTYTELWDRVDDALVFKAMSFIPTRYDEMSIYTLRCENFWLKADGDDSIVMKERYLLTEDIPLSEDLDLIGYIKAHPRLRPADRC